MGVYETDRISKKKKNNNVDVFLETNRENNILRNYGNKIITI